MRRLSLFALLVLGIACSRAQELVRGAIAGMVITAEGDPVGGAVVQAAGIDGGSGEAVTDDRGMFRIFGLRAGRYKLKVEAGPGTIEAGSEPAAWSYPVGAREAEVVVVEGGTTASGKDFVLPQLILKQGSKTGEGVSGKVEEWG